MRCYTVLSKRECFKVLKDSMDSRLAFGRSRFVGWRIGSFFSVKYCAGNEFKRQMAPIQNKVIGYFKQCESKTNIHYIMFRGWTDPISIIGIYMFCLAIIYFMNRSVVDISMPQDYFKIAAMTSGIMIVLSFLNTVYSKEGQVGKQNIKKFLEDKFNQRIA